jgi:uncharacterized protein YodC (DUF2158 family)
LISLLQSCHAILGVSIFGAPLGDGEFRKMTVLKPGDLVILKSGGPVMTVDTVNTDIFDDNKITGILCAWFVGNKLERARFDPGAIVPALRQDALADDAPQTLEAAGEYAVVLGEMVAAMNDGIEPTDDASSAPVQRAKRTSARNATAPAARDAN